MTNINSGTCWSEVVNCQILTTMEKGDAKYIASKSGLSWNESCSQKQLRNTCRYRGIEQGITRIHHVKEKTHTGVYTHTMGVKCPSKCIASGVFCFVCYCLSFAFD